jgi:hypothetical protein
MRSRIALLVGAVVALALLAPAIPVALALLAPAIPASAAATAWDPNDMPGRFDLRWTGAYRQDADTIRLGIRLWHPVRRADFDQRHYVLVSLNPFEQDADAAIWPRPGGGWRARFFDDGSPPALFHARVTHPSGTLFRLWMPAEWTGGQAITASTLGGGGTDTIAIVAP